MKSHYGSMHSQRMHNLVVGMNEAFHDEKRDQLFEMHTAMASDLRQRKRGNDITPAKGNPGGDGKR